MRPSDYAILVLAGTIGAWLGMICWRYLKRKKKK